MKFKSVFIVPPTLGADDRNLFPRNGYTIVDDPDKADALVFCGGADIDPAFYGQRPIPKTFTSPQRDKREVELYQKNIGKPMVGICRGAQFLNAMAGGSMWQHVDHHGGHHHIDIFDVTGKKIGTGTVNSVHHQQMRPSAEGRILAVAHESTTKEDATERIYAPSGERFEDPEIIWYPKQGFYCMQSHPEFGHPETTALFFKHLKELYI